MNEHKEGENLEIKLEEEMTPEELTQLEADEKFILEFKDEDLDNDEKKEQLQKALNNTKSTIAQKKHYRTKFQDLEKQVGQHANGDGKKKEEKAAPNAADLAEKEETNKRIAISDLRLDGFNRDQAVKVYEAAKSMGTSVDKFMQSEVGKAFLEKVKDQGDVEGASFTPKNRTNTPASDKIDWAKATPEQIKAHRTKVQGHR